MQESAGLESRLPAGVDEAKAFEILAGRLDRGVIVLCDHASNALPPEYGTLGLSAEQLSRHIALDIGAAAVARRVALALEAPAVLTRFSRLLIDCNRGLDDPTLIVRISDGVIVVGNCGVEEDEKARRIQRFYAPYHRAIDSLIDAALAAGSPPVLLSVHSFTHCWKGENRPWHAGVLWDTDARLAVPLLQRLSQEEGLTVGDNEPYAGGLPGDCLWQHGFARGLANAIVEVRQDLIGDPAGQLAWGDRLAAAAGELLADDARRHDLNRVLHLDARSK